MRIENGNLAGVGNSGSTGSTSAIGSHHRVTADTDGDGISDSVQLSGASSLVALARQVNAADRQSRIGALAVQVQAGKYQVSAQDVSDSILKSIG